MPKGPAKGKNVPQAPTTAGIPAAPTVTTVALPNKPSAPAAAPVATQDKKLLDALLEHVGNQDDLPTDLASMLNKYRSEDSRAKSKELHRVVARQAEARRELDRIRAERSTFSSNWGSYLSDVLALLEKQLAERDETIQQLDEAEDVWEQRLREAAQQLAKHATTSGTAGSAASVIDVDEEDSVEISEAMAVDAAEEESKRAVARRAQQAQQAQQKEKVLQALRSAQEAAQDPNRERTPRRQRPLDKQSESDAKVPKEEAPPPA